MSDQREYWEKALNLREDEIEEFRTWYEATHGQYKGMISRGLLYNFAIGKVKELQRDSELFYATSNSARLNHAERQEFLDQYNSCLGEIRAYRAVCEWAKEQVEANGRVT